MIADLPPAIPMAEVGRLLGYPPGHAVPRRVRSLLDALTTEFRSLLEPRGACARFAISDADALQLPLPGAKASLSGFGLGLVTIGPRLEERTTAALKRGDATEALLLDAIGSAAAEAAAEALGCLLAGMGGPHAENRLQGQDRLPVRGERNTGGRGTIGGADDGLHPASGSPCRISPGYGGWPLIAQEAIFARLPHVVIGVRLLPSMLMVPRKSVTFALWFDAAGRVVAGRGDCSRCEREPCPRRAVPQRGDPA